MQKQKLLLISGDLFAIATVTVIGFATHGETGLSFLPRMATTFISAACAWFLVSPWLGLFRDDVIRNPRQVWRPALAMIFAGPLAVVLRGLLLNTAILPIFAVVLAATSALGMVVWRGLFWLLVRGR